MVSSKHWMIKKMGEVYKGGKKKKDGSFHTHTILVSSLGKCYCCSVTQSCPDPMDCIRPGFPVLHYLLEFVQTHVHWIDDAIQPSLYPLLLQSFPASTSFPMSQLFVSGAQSIGASTSALVLPMNIQGLLPLRLTGLNFLLSKRLKSLLQHHKSGALVLQCSDFCRIQLSHLYMTTGKAIILTIWTFFSKVMSLKWRCINPV